MLLILGTVLTVAAWRRGWQAWVLLPIGVAALTRFSIGVTLDPPILSPSEAMPLVELGALVMLACMSTLAPEELAVPSARYLAANSVRPSACPGRLDPRFCRMESSRHALSERVLRRLRNEYTRAGKADLFDALSDLLAGFYSPLQFDRLARNLAMSTQQLRIAVDLFRRRYQKILREENTRGLGIDNDIDGELRQLLRSMAC